MRYNSLSAAVAAIVVACAVACAAVSTRAAAQAPASVSTPDASAAADMYARYVAPSQCITGVSRMTSFYWRDKRADTAHYATLKDTLPRMVRDSLRSCVAHFNVATVPDQQVVPMLDIALALDDDALANAVAARADKIIQALPPAKRPWMIEKVALSFLGATPMRLARAREYMHALDAMGASAAYERFSTHFMSGMLTFSLGNVAVADEDVKAMVAAFADLGHAEQLNIVDSLARGYGTYMQVMQLSQKGNVLLAALDSAKNLLVPLTQNGGPWAQYSRARVEASFGAYSRQAGGLGTKATTLHAERWYGVPGDTVFPKSHRVTIVVVGHPAGISFELLAVLRRLHDAYAAKGLDIVASTYTTGWFRTTVVPKPADEMDDFQHWFEDYLHFPVALAAEESQWGRLPDGRRQNEPGANQKAYEFGPNAVLVGKDGTIRLVLNVMPSTEEVYRQQIEKALEE